MEFKFPTQMHNTQLFGVPPSSSSSTYSYFVDQAMNEGFWTGRSVGGSQVGSEVLGRPVDMKEAIHRELEKERIREQVLAEEIYRKRILEVEVRRELMIQQEIEMQSGGRFRSSLILGPSRNRFEPGMLHNQSFAREDRRIEMPLLEMHGSSGLQDCETGGFEVVPFQQSLNIQEVTPSPLENGRMEAFIGLGKRSGAKRKPPKGSSELHSRCSKKIKDEWSCAICKISATCERDLNEHLAGKKHRVKMAALRPKGESKSVEPQPVVISKHVLTDSKEDRESEGGSTSQKYRFWCEICKARAFNEEDMNKHNKGKKHLKNLVKLHSKSAAVAPHDSGSVN